MLHAAVWLFAVICTAGSGSVGTDEPREALAEAAVAAPDPLLHGAGLELNRSLRLARSRDCDRTAIAAELAALGEGALPGALRMLAERKLPAFEGVEAQTTSELQETLLLAALAQCPAGAVWDAVDAQLAVPKDEQPTAAARRAALLAAGTCATPDQLRRIVGIALFSGEQELAPGLEPALRVSLETLYRRTPDGLRALATSWREIPALLLPSIVRAAGATGDPRALELLAQMLDQPGDLGPIALAELVRQSAPADVPDGLFAHLRDLLDPAEPMVCQAACNALGALGDFESVDTLIDLLATPWPGIRTNAYRALCNMSGLALPAQSASWHTWRVREGEWFTRRERILAADIECGTERQAIEALREISVHRWERNQLSDIVAGAAQAGGSDPEHGLLGARSTRLARARAALQAVVDSEEAHCAPAAREALGRCAAP